MSFDKIKAGYKKYADRYIYQLSSDVRVSDFNIAIFSLTATSYQFFLDEFDKEIKVVLNGNEFREMVDYLAVRSYFFFILDDDVVKAFESIDVNIHDKMKVLLHEFVEMSYLNPQEKQEFDWFLKTMVNQDKEELNKLLFAFGKNILNYFGIEHTEKDLNRSITCFFRARQKIEDVFLEKVFPLIKSGEIKM